MNRRIGSQCRGSVLLCSRSSDQHTRHFKNQSFFWYGRGFPTFHSPAQRTTVPGSLLVGIFSSDWPTFRLRYPTLTSQNIVPPRSKRLTLISFRISLLYQLSYASKSPKRKPTNGLEPLTNEVTPIYAPEGNLSRTGEDWTRLSQVPSGQREPSCFRHRPGTLCSRDQSE